MQRQSGQTQSEAEDSKLLSYRDLFDRYIELGVNGDFEQRDREFKNRKAAAPILGRSPTGLDYMIEDGRVAYIRVGSTLLIHIPTSSALLRQRKRWDPGPGYPETP
jgi:hypothetical protein